LIRQSPAASPFLDLLKQRITGGAKRQAPEESPTADNAKDGAKSN
jgi:AsmA protein